MTARENKQYRTWTPEPKIFATKALRRKGYIYDSFFVPWCLSGRMEKVLPQKARK